MVNSKNLICFIQAIDGSMSAVQRKEPIRLSCLAGNKEHCIFAKIQEGKEKQFYDFIIGVHFVHFYDFIYRRPFCSILRLHVSAAILFIFTTSFIGGHFVHFYDLIVGVHFVHFYDFIMGVHFVQFYDFIYRWPFCSFLRLNCRRPFCSFLLLHYRRPFCSILRLHLSAAILFNYSLSAAILINFTT